jgi:hypothetical protein
LCTGGYRSDLRWHADWFALQVVALRCGACFIPEPLAITRIDHASFSRGGRYQWEKQKVVLETVLGYLHSEEFSDVLARFQKGKVLSQMAPWIVRVIVGQRRYWSKDNALLIENSLLRYHEEHLNDPDPVVREGTCVCLGFLGKRAIDLLAPLSLLAHDPEPAVRREARRAYAAIGGSARTLLWQMHYLVSASRMAAKCIVPKIKRAIRPFAAAIYRRINYRLYARMDVFEESLAALIREHAGQIEKLRAEVDRLRQQLQLQATAHESTAMRTDPAILQITFDNATPEQSSPLPALTRRGQAA